MVWDLKRNKLCYSDPDVPLGPNLFSGRSNFLELSWLADDLLQYGGPFSSLDMEGEKSQLKIVNRAKTAIHAGWAHDLMWLEVEVKE